MQDADALARITRELVEAKAADNVRYLEIRWGPLLHTAAGLPLAEGIAAVVGGRGAAAAATGTTVRLIATAIRSHEPSANAAMAAVAARFRDRGLTGFDLAGPEAAFPDPLLHRRAFEVARGPGPADHAACGRVGRRGAGARGRWRSRRSGSRTARARPTTRRSARN